MLDFCQWTNKAIKYTHANGCCIEILFTFGITYLSELVRPEPMQEASIAIFEILFENE